MVDEMRREIGNVLPTGEQFELRQGDRRAVVTEVGATLRSFEVAGQEFLDTFSADEMSTGSRGQVLLPWPNRIDRGAYTFKGATHQLPIDERHADNAIHGLVRWSNWTPIETAADRVVLGLVLHPLAGYPFTLAMELEYALSGGGLSVRTRARNVGTAALPFGAGYHPYLTVGTAQIDEALLRLPAASYLTTGDRLIPTGRAAVAGGDLDFRTARPVGGVRLDTCFADVIPDADGVTRVTLAHPSGSPTLTLAMDGAHTFIQAYTGDTLPEAERRRSIAVEPMTCPPNAFRTEEGLIVLEPGRTFAAEWSLSVS